MFLLDKKYYDCLLDSSYKTNIPLLVFSTTKKYKLIQSHRHKRLFGKSQWSFKKLNLFFDTFIEFSRKTNIFFNLFIIFLISIISTSIIFYGEISKIILNKEHKMVLIVVSFYFWD